MGRPHGLHGEVTVVPDDPSLFAPGTELWSGDTRFVVAAARPYRDRGLVVRFEGVAGRQAAESIRGTHLEVEVDDRPALEEGEYWPEDLVGLEAVDPMGEPIGTVVGVVHGPQDRLVVETVSGHRAEVPFVTALVGDPAGGRIVIDAPPGLLEP